MQNNRSVVAIFNSTNYDHLEENLNYLLGSGFSQLRGWSVHVVLVDEQIATGRTKTIRKLQRKFPNRLIVIEQIHTGGGAKSFNGIDSVFKKLSAEAVVEIGEDLDNPAVALSLFLETIDAGTDIVFGVKKTAGKQFMYLPILLRLILQNLYVFLTRFLLLFPFKQFFTIKDPTIKMKAVRIGCIYEWEDIDASYLTNPAHALEVDYKKIQSGCKVMVVPVYVRKPSMEELKIKNQEIKSLFRTILQLRLKDESTRKFFRFAIVGFSGFIINAVTLELFTISQLTEKIAQLFSFFHQHRLFGVIAHKTAWAAALAAECAIISNYIWNNFWTFSKDRPKRWLKFLVNFVKFNMTSVGAILIQFACVGLATYIISDTPIIRQVSLIITVAFVIIPYNWLIYNRIIWRTKIKNTTK